MGRIYNIKDKKKKDDVPESIKEGEKSATIRAKREEKNRRRSNWQVRRDYGLQD